MSFNFSWPPFDKTDDLLETLTKAFNSNGVPDGLASPLHATRLEFGKTAPSIKIASIDEASLDDGFRLAFDIGYQGEFLIELQSTVQVNPLAPTRRFSRRVLKHAHIFHAQAPLTCPLRLEISNLVVKGTLRLGVNAATGQAQAAFDSDPLQSFTVVSSFDSLPPAKETVKKMIGMSLSDFFMKDLPEIVRKESEPKPKPETPVEDTPTGDTVLESGTPAPSGTPQRAPPPVGGSSSNKSAATPTASGVTLRATPHKRGQSRSRGARSRSRSLKPEPHQKPRIRVRTSHAPSSRPDALFRNTTRSSIGTLVGQGSAHDRRDSTDSQLPHRRDPSMRSLSPSAHRHKRHHLSLSAQKTRTNTHSVRGTRESRV